MCIDWSHGQDVEYGNYITVSSLCDRSINIFFDTIVSIGDAFNTYIDDDWSTIVVSFWLRLKTMIGGNCQLLIRAFSDCGSPCMCIFLSIHQSINLHHQVDQSLSMSLLLSLSSIDTIVWSASDLDRSHRQELVDTTIILCMRSIYQHISPYDYIKGDAFIDDDWSTIVLPILTT